MFKWIKKLPVTDEKTYGQTLIIEKLRFEKRRSVRPLLLNLKINVIVKRFNMKITQTITYNTTSKYKIVKRSISVIYSCAEKNFMIFILV